MAEECDSTDGRKANLANSRIGKGGRPRSVEEFRRVMRTESFCAFAEVSDLMGRSWYR